MTTAPDMAKPWLQAPAPTAEGAHQVLWFQDAAGGRMPITVTPLGEHLVLQLGANPTLAVTLSRAGGAALARVLDQLCHGARLHDPAAPAGQLACARCRRPLDPKVAIATSYGPIHAACLGKSPAEAFSDATPEPSPPGRGQGEGRGPPPDTSADEAFDRIEGRHTATRTTLPAGWADACPLCGEPLTIGQDLVAAGAPRRIGHERCFRAIHGAAAIILGTVEDLDAG